MAGACVGLIAAGLAAAYPNLWIYERELFVETLVFLFSALLIWLSYSFLDAPNVRKAIGIGVLCGLLALTRPEQRSLIVLLVPLVLVAKGLDGGTRLRWVAFGGVASLLVVSPWIIYNNLRFEEPVTLTANFGEALKLGIVSRPIAGDLLDRTIHVQSATAHVATSRSPTPSSADRLSITCATTSAGSHSS